MLALFAFVIGATLIPFIAIPIAFGVFAVYALGMPRIVGMGSLLTRNRPLRRLAEGSPVVLLLAALLVLVAGGALAAPAAAPAPQDGVGLAQLWITPYGNTGAYVGSNANPWLAESWVINVTTNTPTVKINVTSNWAFQAFDVKLRININDISLLNSVTVKCLLCDAAHQGTSQTFHPADFSFGTPTLANGASYPPHGIYPTNFTSFMIGGIGPQGANNTTVLSVAIDGGFTLGMMVNFDADGWTYQNSQQAIIGTFSGTNIRNPYSHDTTVQIPDVTSVVVPAGLAGIAYLALVRRKRKSS